MNLGLGLGLRLKLRSISVGIAKSKGRQNLMLSVAIVPCSDRPLFALGSIVVTLPSLFYFI